MIEPLIKKKNINNFTLATLYQDYPTERQAGLQLRHPARCHDGGSLRVSGVRLKVDSRPPPCPPRDTVAAFRIRRHACLPPATEELPATPAAKKLRQSWCPTGT